MKGILVRAGLLMALVLVATTEAAAQAGAVRGKVVDSKGMPIVEAQILIEYQGGVTRKLTTKTNKKGEYTQVGMGPGRYKFTISKEGMQPVTLEQKVSMGEATQIPEMTLQSLSAAAKVAAPVADPAADLLRESYAKAAALLAEKKYPEAEAAFLDLAVKNPTVPEIHYSLGQIHDQKKDWASAEASYRKALELKPTFNDASIALVGMYQRSGQADKAGQLMSKTAGENTGDPNVQFNLGVTYLNANKNEEALAAFTKAAELKPDMAEAHYRMGTIAVGMGKIDDAVKHLEKYLSLNPTDAQNTATAKGLIGALKK